ncbi:MAG: hypothetical protein ACXABY_17875 [Candidatus Thorarchaeota archaeon]|jgi:hypothetical protein
MTANTHHKALASWSAAITATENALKRLQSIGSSNCNNEAYVTTQLENADDYLCRAIENIRSFATPRPGALTKRPSAPKPPEEPRVWLDSGLPVHDDDCECRQCKRGMNLE